jgi:hypothetical protein
LAAVVAAPFVPYEPITLGFDINKTTYRYWQNQITFKGFPVFVDDTLPANAWYLCNPASFHLDTKPRA